MHKIKHTPWHKITSENTGKRDLSVFTVMFILLSFADGFCSEHGVTFETTILDKFEVAFGAEGETLSLGCTVIVYPNVKNYQPEVIWCRNCK